MACKYLYENSEFKSMEALKLSLLNNVNKSEGIREQTSFISRLRARNNDLTQDQVISKLETYFNLRKPATIKGYSTIKRDLERTGRTVRGENPRAANPEFETLENIKLDIGEQIHKLAELKSGEFLSLNIEEFSREEKVKTVIKSITNKLLVNKDNPAVKDYFKWFYSLTLGTTQITENTTLYNDLLGAVSSKCFNTLTSIDPIVKSGLSTTVLYPEKTLYFNIDDELSIEYRPDLIAITADGRVIIYDYKTTSLNKLSNFMNLDHYMQLEFYKSMLSKATGIPLDKISYLNIIINLDTITDANGFKISLETPTIGKETSEFKRVFNAMRRYIFPLKVVNLNQVEIDRRKEIINALIKTITNGKIPTRNTPDSIKNWLLHNIDNDKAVYLTVSTEKHLVRIKILSDKTVIVEDEAHNKIDSLSGITLDQLAEKEANAINQQYLDDIATVKYIILNKDRESMVEFFLKKKSGIKIKLTPYLSNEWEIIEIPYLEEYGILLLKNAITNQIDILNLTTIPSPGQFIYDYTESTKKQIWFRKKPYNDSQNRTLVDAFIPGTITDNYNINWPLGTVGNITQLTSYIILQLFKDILPESISKNYAIGTINVISTADGNASENIDISTLEKICRVILKLARLHRNDGIVKNAEFFLDIADIIDNNKLNILEKTQLLQNELASLVSILSDSEENIRDIANLDYDELLLYIDELIEKYKDFNPRKTGGVLETIESQLYVTLINLKLLITGMSRSEQISKINKYNLDFHNTLIAGYEILFRGDLHRYNSVGLKITGIVLGLSTAPSYSNPDEGIRRLGLFMNAMLTQVQKQLVKEMREANEAFRKFIAFYNIPIAKEWIGNHNDIYKKLLETDNSGEVIPIFKNPYKKDTDLDDIQKEFLEVHLWLINKHRISSYQLDSNILEMSYEELKLNDEAFKSYKELVNDDPKLLQMPLLTKQGIVGLTARFKSFIKSKKEDMSFMDYLIEEFTVQMKYATDSSATTISRLERRKEAIKNLEVFPNMYKESDSYRAETLRTHTMDAFVLNINLLTGMFIFADLREKMSGKLLQRMDEELAAIYMIEATTGKDLSNLVDEIIDRIKVNIYGESIVIDELKDLGGVFGFFKLIFSAMKLGLRPALWIKEETLGLIKNNSSILAGTIINDTKIKLSDLNKAEGIIIQDNYIHGLERNLSSDDYYKKSKVALINLKCRINDYDLSVMGEKSAADSKGLYNVSGRMIFVTSFAPDNDTRMALFISKMIADGCYDAYTVTDDNYLEYNPGLDDRFSYFWNNKERDKLMLKDKKYIEQKALYVLRLIMMQLDGWTDEFGKKLHYRADDVANISKIPMGYTLQELDSIKELIGMLYGNYNQEERATMQNGGFWKFYSLFLTFLPGSIRKWLAVGTDSSVGTMEHMKDPSTGKELYWKRDENNIQVKTTEEFDENGNYNEPVYNFVHLSVEGLIVSFGRCLHYTLTAPFSKSGREWWKNPKNSYTIRNAALCLFNLLLGYLLSKLLISILKGIITDKKETREIEMTMDMMRKVGNELSFYSEVISPIDTYGLIGVNVMKNIFGLVGKAMTVDKYSVLDAFENFSTISDLHLSNED